MIEGRGLPEDLERMAPGPDLARLLASVDRAALPARDRLRVARARNRLVSHMQSELLSDLYSVTWDEPPPDEVVHGDQASRYPWADAEVAFAMRWTRVAAGGRLEDARRLIEDLPRVHAALRAGDIDMPKALVIRDLVALLEDGPARAVVDRIIDRAPELTTGQLRARLRSLVLALDPDAARGLCASGVRTRRVEAFDSPDGTGELWGRSLAPQGTAAAWERLTAIARAARSSGDRRTMDQLRSDALLDLVCGEGIAMGEPVTRHTAGLPGVDEHGGGASGSGSPGSSGSGSPGGDFAGDTWPGTEWDQAWPAEPPPERIGPHDVRPDPTGAPVDAWDDAGWAFDGADLWPSDWPGRWLDDPAVASAAGARPRGRRGAGTPAAPMPGPRRGVVELQVPLTTLLGLSRQPGQLAGFGPVVADIARQVAAEQRAATWRFSVYDRAGDLLRHGITRQRPTGPPGTDHGRGRPPPGQRSTVDSDTRPAGQRDGGHARQRDGRRPTAEVAAFVRARDRTCVAPGCRRSATGCDLDHTVDWAAGGGSDTGNLGLLCRRHHRFKHAPGSDLIQFTPGSFGWTTPPGCSTSPGHSRRSSTTATLAQSRT
jgi:hypothetical protein